MRLTAHRYAVAGTIAALGVATTMVLAAASAAPQERDAAVERARAVIEGHRIELDIPGISAAVGIGGTVVWSEGFGYADLENRVPARGVTRYRVGSVSKPMTATALVQLALAGRLDLDAPVQRYVPAFPEKRFPITTRQVAGHLSGIRHYRGNESVAAGQRHYDDVVDALGIFGEDPLLFEPGERYLYSSYGWNLLSAVVQGAAGEPFLEYMRGNVFEPLGMNATDADDPRLIMRDRARFYSAGAAGQRNAPFVDNSYKWAGGGFIASVEDLVRFGSAHLNAGFLPRQGLDLLFTSQRTSDGEETGYGIGWRVGTLGDLAASGAALRDGEFADLRIRQHGGSSVGGRAILLLIPEREMVVAILVNYNRFGGGAVAAALAEAFLRE